MVHLKLEGIVPDKEETVSHEPNYQKQYLEAHFSKKGRAGKVVTLIKGFEGETENLKELAKILKRTVNTGGTVKNGEILIQGNFRDQIIEKIHAMGHEVKRIGG